MEKLQPESVTTREADGSELVLGFLKMDAY